MSLFEVMYITYRDGDDDNTAGRQIKIPVEKMRLQCFCLRHHDGRR